MMAQRIEWLGMHEISLATNVLAIVEESARRESCHAVRALRLEVGKLAGVAIPALRFAFEAIAPGTCLAGARIRIDEPEGAGRCPRCGIVPIEVAGEPCPRCGSHPIPIERGTEFRVVEMLIDDTLADDTVAPHQEI